MTKVANTLGWLTVAEIADRLKLSKMTVYRMIEHKEITAFKFGRAYRIKPEHFDEYVAKSQID